MTLKSSLARGLVVLCAIVAQYLPVYAGDEPDYLRQPLAQAWRPDSLLARGLDGDALNTSWWESFGDPVLDSLISLGRANNYNLAITARRIEIARRQLQQVRSEYYPGIDLNIGWQRERQSGRLAGREGNAGTMSYFSGGATMSWEVDVFGKITAKARQSKEQVRLSAAEYDAALVALDAEIASAYIELLADKAQLALANEHAASQKHILDITETRFRTGLVSKLDVAQASTLYYSTIASIPMLEASIEAAYNSIAVLLGTDRDGLPSDIFSARDMPSNYDVPVLGAPVDLLRRRPDIVAAERSIDLAAAALGVARSAYLPSLSIAASVGTGAHAFGDLFSGPSFTYSIAPTLSWTLFDGFSRHAARLEAKMQLENEIDSYNLTVLTAVEEVRNAMARYSATLKYISNTDLVVENSAEAVRLSLDQYKQGLTDFYNVVEAQLNYLTYQNSLVTARAKALTALVDLYKALGGGF